MRLFITALAAVGVFLAASQAEAASCSGFATFKQIDKEANFVQVKWVKGSESRYFPKTEGTPANNSKIPAMCKTRIKKKITDFRLKPVGGKMSITQVRENFSGKMKNPKEDEGADTQSGYLYGTIEKLMKDKTKVAIIVRDGVTKDDPYNLTTIYLPITDEEKAEIARLDAQATDED